MENYSCQILLGDDSMDWDNFCCMIPQVHACKHGWGMIQIIPVVYTEEKMIYTWKNNGET